MAVSSKEEEFASPPASPLILQSPKALLVTHMKQELIENDPPTSGNGILEKKLTPLSGLVPFTNLAPLEHPFDEQVDAKIDIVDTLYDWTIVVKENWGLCVDGNRRSARNEFSAPWTTSVITKRIDSHQVVTCSGSVYQLSGNFNGDLAIKEGIPISIVDRFANGFPLDWRNIIQLHFPFTYRKRSMKAKSSLMPHLQSNPNVSPSETGDCRPDKLKSSISDSKMLSYDQNRGHINSKVHRGIISSKSKNGRTKKSFRKTRRSDKPEDLHKTSISSQGKPAKNLESISYKNGVIQRMRKGKKENCKQSVDKKLSSADCKNENTPERSTESSPNLLTIDDFPTSRSGRKIVPPLAGWANQRKMYYHRQDVTGIIPGTPNGLIGYNVLQFKNDQNISILEANLSIERAKFKRTRSSTESPGRIASDVDKKCTRTIKNVSGSTHKRSNGELVNISNPQFENDVKNGRSTRGEKESTVEELKRTSRKRTVFNRSPHIEMEDVMQATGKTTRKYLDKAVKNLPSNSPDTRMISENEKILRPRTCLSYKKDLYILRNSAVSKNLSASPRKTSPSTTLIIAETSRRITPQKRNSAAETKLADKKLKPTKKEKQPESQNKPARKGTLKRKRQLREAIAQHQGGHTDDIFDATPAKKMKVQVLPKDAPYDNDSDDEFFRNMKTPGILPSKTPTQRMSWMPKVFTNTPVSTVVSPDFFGVVERNSVDVYINRLKQRSKPGRKVLPLNSATKLKGKHERSKSVPVTSDMFAMSNIPDVEEDEADFYFSDENT